VDPFVDLDTDAVAASPTRDDFFSVLYGDASGFVELRMLPSKRSAWPTTPAERDAFLSANTDDNQYFGVALTPRARRTKRRGVLAPDRAVHRHRLQGHAREALALARRLGARGSEAHTLCLSGDVASTGSAVDAEDYYRESVALAGELGMSPLVAHCYLGLGKLYRRTDKREQAREHLTTATTMYRDMGMTYWLEKAEAEMTKPGG
jgi:hypothetical protein